MNLLKSLESAVDNETEPEAPVEEETATEDEAPATETEPEEGEEAPTAEEGEEAPAVEDDGTALDPKAEFTVDGEKVTGEELLKSRLRHADYTRKTQELAEERKAFEQERTAEKDKVSDYEEFLSGIKDVNTLELELERYYPDTLQALRDRIIEQAIEEQGCSTDAERDRLVRLRKSELREAAAKRDQELAGKRTKAREHEQKTAELRKTYLGWAAESMAAAGLDAKDQDHYELVAAKVTKNKGQWTKETFQEAAKAAAKVLGKTPPAAKATPKLPPVRTLGHKAPPGEKAKLVKKAAPKKTSEDFFSSLRKQNGGAF